jgi:hypothetical protein
MHASIHITTELCYFQEVMMRKAVVTVKRMNSTAQCKVSILVFLHISYVMDTNIAMMG